MANMSARVTATSATAAAAGPTVNIGCSGPVYTAQNIIEIHPLVHQDDRPGFDRQAEDTQEDCEQFSETLYSRGTQTREFVCIGQRQTVRVADNYVRVDLLINEKAAKIITGSEAGAQKVEDAVLRCLARLEYKGGNILSGAMTAWKLKMEDVNKLCRDVINCIMKEPDCCKLIRLIEKLFENFGMLLVGFDRSSFVFIFQHETGEGAERLCSSSVDQEAVQQILLDFLPGWVKQEEVYWEVMRCSSSGEDPEVVRHLSKRVTLASRQSGSVASMDCRHMERMIEKTLERHMRSFNHQISEAHGDALRQLAQQQSDLVCEIKEMLMKQYTTRSDEEASLVHSAKDPSYSLMQSDNMSNLVTDGDSVSASSEQRSLDSGFEEKKNTSKTHERLQVNKPYTDLSVHQGRDKIEQLISGSQGTTVSAYYTSAEAQYPEHASREMMPGMRNKPAPGENSSHVGRQARHQVTEARESSGYTRYKQPSSREDEDVTLQKQPVRTSSVGLEQVMDPTHHLKTPGYGDTSGLAGHKRGYIAPETTFLKGKMDSEDITKSEHSNNSDTERPFTSETAGSDKHTREEGDDSLRKSAGSDEKRKTRKEDDDSSPRKSSVSDKEHRSRGEDDSSPSAGEKTSDSPKKVKESKRDQADYLLNWVNVKTRASESKDPEIQRLLEQVELALQDEDKESPTAKAMDTVIVLDTSDSIVNDHLDELKTVVITFVDGIEDNVDTMNLEENLAVVQMGSRAWVRQHLTNDYSRVRDAVDVMTPDSMSSPTGGRTAMFQALLVCLGALEGGKGGVVTVAGCHRVRPRLIIFTDGRPTDEVSEFGADLQSNLSGVKFALVQLMTEFASKKHRKTPAPIFWVPIGDDTDRPFMESLAALSGGKVVEKENVQELCRYYKIQEMIGCVYKMVRKHKDFYETEQQALSVVNALAGDLNEDEKRYIIEEVRKKQKDPEHESEDPDDFDNIFEDTELVQAGVLLPLGTRVRRGPHWKWKNQDTEGPGTVLHHRKKRDGWLHVMWDNGTNNAYRYDREYQDVVEALDEPRILVESQMVEIGVLVRRGDDWKSGDEDGKGTGVVIRKRRDGKVKVRWENGFIGKYKYGADGKMELTVVADCLPREPTMGERSSPAQPESESEGGAAGGYDPAEGPPRKVWQWWDPLQKEWRMYSAEIQDKLLNAYEQRHDGSCLITRQGKSRRVLFKMNQEKSVNKGGGIVLVQSITMSEMQYLKMLQEEEGGLSLDLGLD